MLPEDDLNAQYYRLRAQQISNRHTLENYQRYGALAPVLAEFSSLCSGFLHDLGNGLNAIQGKLESLSLEPLDPQQAQAVVRAKSLCTLCGWRIYALAEISPRAPMHPEPANLPELIPRLLDALAAVQPLSVRTVFHTAVPRLIVADYGNALRLVLVELLLNAFQAIPSGGQVAVSVQRLDGRLAQIEIADTGTGLPPQDPEECFDLRFTTRPHRYGLGLYVARRVVEKHRGTFTLFSETGPGTRVTLQLPTGNPEPDWDDEDALVRELENLHDAVARQEREIEVCQSSYALPRDEKLNQLSSLFGQLGASIARFVEAGVSDIQRGLAPLADQMTGQAANSIRFILEKCDYCRAVLGNVRALDSDYAIRREPVDLNQIAAQAVRLMAWRAQAGTQLHLVQAESLPVVKADELLVTTALVNLLRNALDAAGRDSQVEVETAFARHAVVISVTNTGATIPPDVRPRIFDLDCTTRQGHDFGLGVTIAQAVVLKHDGTITLQDMQQSQTRLEITLSG